MQGRESEAGVHGPSRPKRGVWPPYHHHTSIFKSALEKDELVKLYSKPLKKFFKC